MIYDYIIIGAGLSGSLLSHHFEKNNISHLVVDKGRGLGGRLSSKRFDHEIFFNHGSQMIAFNEYEKQEWFQSWIQKGWLKKRKTYWSIETKSSDLVKSLMNLKNVLLNEEVFTIEKQNSKYQIQLKSEKILLANKVIVTAPLPQALLLCQKLISKQHYEKMSLIHYSKKIIFFLKNKKLLRFSSSTDFTIETKHSNHMINLSDDLSDQLFEKTNSEITHAMVSYFTSFFEDFTESDLQVKKWRFSQPMNSLTEDFFKNEESRLYICGDAFCAEKKSSIERSLHSTLQLLNEVKPQGPL